MINSSDTASLPRMFNVPEKKSSTIKKYGEWSWNCMGNQVNHQEVETL